MYPKRGSKHCKEERASPENSQRNIKALKQVEGHSEMAPPPLYISLEASRQEEEQSFGTFSSAFHLPPLPANRFQL